MMDVALTILAVVAGGFTMELFTPQRPLPRGESPWHVAVEPEDAKDAGLGNPS